MFTCVSTLSPCSHNNQQDGLTEVFYLVSMMKSVSVWLHSFIVCILGIQFSLHMSMFNAVSVVSSVCWSEIRSICLWYQEALTIWLVSTLRIIVILTIVSLVRPLVIFTLKKILATWHWYAGQMSAFPQVKTCRQSKKRKKTTKFMWTFLWL